MESDHKYVVSVSCTNCLKKDDLSIPYGEAVCHQRCPNCGLTSLEPDRDYENRQFRKELQAKFEELGQNIGEALKGGK